MDTKRFSALIESVYAAAVGRELWPDVAAQIAGFFGSESAGIQVRDGKLGGIPLLVTTANIDESARRDYADHFHKSDLWANRWRAIGASGIYTGAELVDPETLRRSEYYTDWCRNRGIFHFLGAGVDLDQGTSLLLGIHRPMETDDSPPRIGAPWSSCCRISCERCNSTWRVRPASAPVRRGIRRTFRRHDRG